MLQEHAGGIGFESFSEKNGCTTLTHAAMLGGQVPNEMANEMGWIAKKSEPPKAETTSVATRFQSRSEMVAQIKTTLVAEQKVHP